MAYKYFPQTPADVAQMLSAIGVESVDELYADVPPQLRMAAPYALPPAMSEIEVRQHFERLAKANRRLVCFAGAGAYDHYTPAVAQWLQGRSEFQTAYTPYQAEVSQGTLQYIFEYQSMIADLTGLDTSNASLYDGSTATAEAMLMAVSASKRRRKVLISDTVSPRVRQVVATYAKHHGVALRRVPQSRGATRLESIERAVRVDDVAAVIVAQPNFYGIIEDYSGLADTLRRHGTLLIMNAEPQSLALLRTPGEWGADIAVGECQSLGMPMSFGGPYMGYMCARRELVRKMPGRIVGATRDANGQRVFVLTLQAREQHIRRQRATSNICSNEGMLTLFVATYLSLLGRRGLEQANSLSLNAAHYLCERLQDTGRFRLVFPSRPYYNEFLMATNADIDALMARWTAHGFMGGVKVDVAGHGSCLLLCATEKRTRQEIDEFVSLVNIDQ